MESQENQFKYYVREDFNPAYRSKVTTRHATRTPHALHEWTQFCCRQVEEEVDTRWVQYLRDSCYAQMQEKKNLVNKYALSLAVSLSTKERDWPMSETCVGIPALFIHSSMLLWCHHRARWQSGARKTKLMEEANSYPLSACEVLADKGFRVPNYSR